MQTVISSHALYKKEFASIKERYPKITSHFVNGKYYLQGSIDITGDSGEKYDEYEILIEFPVSYPSVFPVVFEKGGRIERVPDMHINNDGSCCLGTMASMFVLLKGKITLLDFMNELVVPYFANQTHKFFTGEYANGEFAHGVIGIYQFYSSTFGIDNLEKIIDLLLRVISGNLPKRNEPCMCKSEKKYKKCHLSAVRTLSKVSKEVLIKDCDKLIHVLEILTQNTKLKD